jgi:hypothetical protein
LRKKLGCGQEGGEERITAARGHRSTLNTLNKSIKFAFFDNDRINLTFFAGPVKDFFLILCVKYFIAHQ